MSYPPSSFSRETPSSSLPISACDGPGTVTQRSSSGPSVQNDGPALVQASAFRNVSACNRCRLRKHRCDQRLPQCQPCEKARVRCVGYDPITKQEVPRSYVFWLENRVDYLKNVLLDHNIAFRPEAASDEDKSSSADATSDIALSHIISRSPELESWPGRYTRSMKRERSVGPGAKSEQQSTRLNDQQRFHDLISDMLPGKTALYEFGAPKATRDVTNVKRNPIQESFFGLQGGKSHKNYAAFPDRDLANTLVDLYFDYANPQIPILNRAEFMGLLDLTYSTLEEERPSCDLCFLYLVFAIGAAIVFDTARLPAGNTEYDSSLSSSLGPRKRQKVSSKQYQPEEYHASAMAYMELSVNSSFALDQLGTIKYLQAIVLLGSFSLLRPVVPGLSHVIGLTLRWAVDLGLHDEAETDDDHDAWDWQPWRREIPIQQEEGSDIRRRLWWCIYSLDRLVAPFVGPPFFGVADHVITAKFPHLEDKYEHVSLHYFKLRILQSEIYDALQHQPGGRTKDHRSDGLRGFKSLNMWRRHITRQLDEWRAMIPRQRHANARFPTIFMELEYWQSLLMLYRPTIIVPPELVGRSAFTNHVSEQHYWQNAEDGLICLKVAEAGQRVLRIHRAIHHVHLINLTYLATHGIFLAGSLFLFAVWNSSQVRQKLVRIIRLYGQYTSNNRRQSLNGIDYTLRAATSVLNDFVDIYPPARHCGEALERMGIATVQMCLTTTGFMTPGGSFPSTGYRRDHSPTHDPSSPKETLPPSIKSPLEHMHQAKPNQMHFAPPLTTSFTEALSTGALEREPPQISPAFQRNNSAARSPSSVSTLADLHRSQNYSESLLEGSSLETAFESWANTPKHSEDQKWSEIALEFLNFDESKIDSAG
ncbi:fungal-specific transcription factor domain-containing protein [Penicillium riverlandense]|uniref:fungal-specific transcription factor domain-containing protein n=1 Tax=Penicillium riverlandense TaxID=1903569 RepID=UPI002548DB52|nr:fungal-specific transcription factor domain-containing protein [Penicillium riverlandense]KAJ5806702.1 fungal-specific transcription factor domain-containing protein [Penicillium riverlandense]